MLKNVEYIKGVLKKTHKGRYVVKPIKTNLLKYKRMNKRAFTKILRTLKEIEDRRDFLAAEIGMDMTAYEDWDGKITVKIDEKDKEVDFKTSSQVWDVLKKFED
jgi:viroplasmin and RNaseH domain-containing protein